MQNWTADILLDAGLELGEGATWHPLWKRFLYVDIENKKVGRIDPLTRISEEIQLDKRVSAVVPATNNKLLVALQGSLALLNFDDSITKELIKVETEKSDNRSNDGKCDVQGRFWIGTMHISAKHNEGALYRYYNNTIEKMIANTSVSNGLGWSPDNRTMYYIDSFDHNIKAFDFDATSGIIKNERIIIKITDPGCVPDGMCVDAEGMIWVAIWGGGAVHRYDPVTGKQIGLVKVDTPNVSNCTFGSENMNQLFITTARSGLNREQLKQYPLSGGLFIADVTTKGLQPYFYNDLNHHS